MAPERPRRERRLAALNSALRFVAAIAVPTLAAVTSCAPAAPQTGWLDASGPSAEPVDEISLHPGSELTVLVELPSGYVPAELVQRAVLTVGDLVQADEQSPAAATAAAGDSIDFVLRYAGQAVPGEPATAPTNGAARTSHGTLKLFLGFCEPDAKEICYFDLPSLPVRDTGTPDAAGQGVGPMHLIYRPEAPQ